MARIDLRSDTVTHPSPAMRRAMADAELGDDVFGDDPTVIALEERAAELLGKEAGLFVASGTMGNLVAQMAHLGRGQETIAGREHHVVLDEAAGHAVIVGTSIRALEDRADGTLDPAEIDAAFRDATDVHEPITGLVTIENTHAHAMGQPLTPAYTREVADIAHAHGVPLHIDGARLWNAVVALGVRVTDLAGPADTVTFCLSKGLACPIGSVLVGPRDTIWRARRARKMVGGGMRQVGILAAAGLVALSDGPDGMIERLAEDHANARRLAEAPGRAWTASCRPVARPSRRPAGSTPTGSGTNFVLFKVERDRAAFLAALRARGVEMVEYPHGQVRAVTHYGVTAADIETTIVATRAALADTAIDQPGVRGIRTGRRQRLTRPAIPLPVHTTSPPSGGLSARDRSTSRRAVPASRAGGRPGPLDDSLYDLVETRFVRLVRDNPVFATAVGLHQDDDLLGDGSREALLGELADEREHLAEVEAIDPAGLSREARFERDLEIHNVRRAIFDHDELRIWERRSFALDHVGDGLFLLFARDHAPLPERLDAIAGRLEAVATYLEEAKTRADGPPGPALAAGRDRDGRRAARLLRRDRRRRGGRPAAGRSNAA